MTPQQPEAKMELTDPADEAGDLWTFKDPRSVDDRIRQDDAFKNRVEQERQEHAEPLRSAMDAAGHWFLCGRTEYPKHLAWIISTAIRDAVRAALARPGTEGNRGEGTATECAPERPYDFDSRGPEGGSWERMRSYALALESEAAALRREVEENRRYMGQIGMDGLRSERDELRSIRDGLVADRDALRAKCEQLERDATVLREEASKVRCQVCRDPIDDPQLQTVFGMSFKEVFDLRRDRLAAESERDAAREEAEQLKAAVLSDEMPALRGLVNDEGTSGTWKSAMTEILHTLRYLRLHLTALESKSTPAAEARHG